MKKCENVSSEDINMLPWKVDVEFDDTLSCKLYSQLSFCDEDDELTAPPSSPVGSFKYAPLLKIRKSSEDMDNLFSLFDNSDVENSSCIDPRIYNNSVYTKEVNTSSDEASLPSRYTERCKEEKLGFTEGSYVTKSYSEESIFPEDSIDDVNEDNKIKFRCTLSLEHLSKRDKNKKRSVNSKVSLNSSPEFRKGNSKEHRFEEFSLSKIVDKKSKRYVDPQRSLCTLYRPSNEDSRNMLTEVDKIQLVGKKSDSLNEGNFIESKLWKHALFANRSSNNFCPSNSMSQNGVANYTRYVPERYTFLRERSIPKNYKRTVRLRSSVNLLDFRNRWIKGS